jgi:2-polyprenyl-6-methoxyphenol hydroxylase-like FAD-dependent oxidoreductase
MTEQAMLSVRCCVVGGGPAGMMLGLLLARSGVAVAVLEKHADFLRDFRGDTIHPSTLELMHELGFLEEFLARPHQEVSVLQAQIGERTIPVGDFSRLPTRCGFVAFMPQWDFLDFLAAKAKAFPHFHLLQRAEATDLITENGRIVGVTAATPEGPRTIRADLVVGADGRHSTVRERAGLAVEALGAPIDVLWFRLSRAADDPAHTMGRFGRGTVFVLINREDYWQCGFVIAKDSIEPLKARGLPAFRAQVGELEPFLAARTAELASWDDVKLLTVQVDRLNTWHRPGLLCIGDAAHAMSPVGGVGINLAIQDAVATANLLTAALRDGRPVDPLLPQVQRRRLFPTRVTQRAQVLIQNKVISGVLSSKGELPVPWPLKLLARFPILRRIPARLVGLGVRPEHVRTAPAPPPP